jgi:hypothetical protein
MKLNTIILVVAIAAPAIMFAADADKKAKPYPLDKCIVSDEKLGADPSMTPYVFVVDGQQVKLCCKSCLKDFNKDKAGYLKKIAAAQKNTK